jgi:hypothetical protein
MGLKKMFSFKNWNKPTPARISNFIKMATAAPVIAAYLTDHTSVAIGIAVLGAFIDTFYGPNDNSNTQ